MKIKIIITTISSLLLFINCKEINENKELNLINNNNNNIQLNNIINENDNKKRRYLEGPEGGGQQGGQQGGQAQQGGQQGQGPEGGQQQGQQGQAQQGGQQQGQGPEGQQQGGQQQGQQQQNQGPEGQQQQGQQQNQQQQKDQGPEGQQQQQQQGQQQGQQNQQQQGPEQQNQNQQNQQQKDQQGQQQQNQGPEQQNQQNQQQQNQQNQQNQGPEQQNQQNQQQQNQQQQNEQQQKEQQEKEQQEKEQQEKEQQEKEQQEKEQQEKEQQEREQQEQKEQEQREGQIDCSKYPWRCPIPTPAPSPYQAHPDYLRPTSKPSQLYGSNSDSSNIMSSSNLAQDAEIGFVIGVGVVVAALFFGIALIAYRAKVHVGVARRVRNYLHNRDGGENMSVLEVALAMLEGGDSKPHRNFDASGHSQDGLTDSYNNRVPFGTAIDVSIRDSQRGPSNANYYPNQQYPVYPHQQSPGQSSPFSYPYGPGMGVPPNVVAHTGPRPTNLAGPGMVPYGMPPQPPSSQMDPARKSPLVPPSVVKPVISATEKRTHDF